MPPERWLIRLEPEAETLGPVLRRLRMSRGWTLYELATRVWPERGGEQREMKNKESLLSRYENNQMKNPDRAVLDRLEDIYGLARDTLTLAHSRTQRYVQQLESIPEDEAVVVIPKESHAMKLFEAASPVTSEDVEELVDIIRNFADLKQRQRRERDQRAG